MSNTKPKTDNFSFKENEKEALIWLFRFVGEKCPTVSYDNKTHSKHLRAVAARLEGFIDEKIGELSP